MNKLTKLFINVCVVVFVFISFTQSTQAATLSINPATGAYTAGDTFKVDILLDTEGDDVIGSDVIILFDSAKLEVADAELGDLFGTKVTDGSVSYGKILFEAVALGSNTYNGDGVYASIMFTAIADGNANVDIKFISEGNTTDSSVNSDEVNSTDLLTQVNNAVFVIKEATASSKTNSQKTATSTSVKKTTTPVSGNPENTIALFSGGAILILSGVFLKRKNQTLN